jgi:hypothetical protein
MQDFDDKASGGVAVFEQQVKSFTLPAAESSPGLLHPISLPSGEYADNASYSRPSEDTTYYGDVSDLDQEEVLYSSQTRDVFMAAEWLAGAPQNITVRITGGCLDMDQPDVEEIQQLLVSVLEDFRGSLISGDSISEDAENPGVTRPCIPEVGPMVAKENPEARHLGVFPGETLKRDSEGIEIGRDLVDGVEWKIKAHSRPGRRLAALEAEESFWAAERRQVHEQIIPTLDMIRRQEAIAVIGFDGGPETEAEYRQVADLSLQDDRYHLFLIQGGGKDRATDSLCVSKEFLEAYPNVHVVSKDFWEIRGALIAEGVIRFSD